jgi:hypothetical protein
MVFTKLSDSLIIHNGERYDVVIDTKDKAKKTYLIKFGGNYSLTKRKRQFRAIWFLTHSCSIDAESTNDKDIQHYWYRGNNGRINVILNSCAWNSCKLIKCKLIFVFFRQTGYFVKIAIS